MFTDMDMIIISVTFFALLVLAAWAEEREIGPFAPPPPPPIPPRRIMPDSNPFTQGTWTALPDVKVRQYEEITGEPTRPMQMAIPREPFIINIATRRKGDAA